MKEKDVVDFTKMNKNENGYYVDEQDNAVGCEICYTHQKAFSKLRDMQITDDPLFNHPREVVPLCPQCGKLMRPYSDFGQVYGTVSEVNYSNPEGNIGMYEFYHCENDDCDGKDYAMMPIPIVWNANHDIHYTGGRDYSEESDIDKLVSDIFKKIKPSIEQYVRRKLNPSDPIDRNLNMDNVNLWCKRDVEHAVCNWLYEHGYKK